MVLFIVVINRFTFSFRLQSYAVAEVKRISICNHNFSNAELLHCFPLSLGNEKGREPFRGSLPYKISCMSVYLPNVRPPLVFLAGAEVLRVEREGAEVLVDDPRF